METISTFCVLLTFFTTTFISTVSAELKQVNLVFRHGDRSPIDIFPTDDNQIDSWPQGLGWLSTIGMNEHYQLGNYFHQRYAVDQQFLNASYVHTEIVIESSDEDRCLMSAYCNLAGLYPPKDAQKWNPDLNWQPIPVHTRPRVEDNYLNMGEGCPRYQSLMDETLKSFKVTEEEKQNKAFYEFIGKQTQWNHENISNIWRVADTLICEEHHNMTLNNFTRKTWGNGTVMDKLKELEAYQFTLMYDSVEKARLKGGPLLKDFISNMQASSTGMDTYKIHMYSGHDTTVAALLSALGLYDGKSPQYASSVIVELHEKTAGNYYVNIFYKNVTDIYDVVQLTLPGCDADCPLDQFVALTKHSVPVDWNLECSNTPDAPSDGKTLSTAWIVVIALSALLLVTVIVNVVCFIKSRRNRGAGTTTGEGDFHANSLLTRIQLYKRF